MLKILALIDTPIWMLIVAVLVIIIVAQRRRLRGLDEPHLLLPKKERQAYARELISRERDEYQEELLARLSRPLVIEKPPWARKEEQ